MKKWKQLVLNRSQTLWVLGMTLFLLVIMLDRVGARPGANSASRFATVESLVHYGTYKINRSRFAWTIDKIKIGDDYYSSKPPMTSTLAAGVYWVYHHVVGNSFILNPRATVIDLNILFSIFPYFILVFYFLRFLRLTMHDSRKLVLAYGVFCLNCLVAGYATDLNNHSPAAIVLFVAFYYAYLLRNGYSDKAFHWLLTGLLCGFLPTFEIPGVIVSAALFFYLLSHNARKTLLYLLPVAFLPVILNLYLTYMATGSPLPAYFRPELYQFKGSYWSMVRKPGIDGLNEPKPIYLFHMLFGHHGILAMTPVFFFAVAQMWKRVRDKGREFIEARMILACSVVLVFLYMIKTTNYGGVCVGFRWLVFIMPLLFIFVARWIEEEWPRLKPLFIVCVVLGGLTVNKATINPWSTSYWHRFIYYIGLGSR